jgi:uncharacterized spore protein YtfJ
MSNSVSDLIKSVVGELKEVARSETVIGRPVTIGDRTVVPVVKISFGFGAGGGQGEAAGTGGFGGGGGGGAKIEPAAFIVMDKDSIKILPAGKGKWDAIIDAIPGIAKKLGKIKDSFKKDGGGEAEAEDWFDSVGEEDKNDEDEE